MDRHSKEQRHKNMQAIMNKKTKLENLVCKALWNKNARFGRNVVNLPGKPDIAIKKYKTVVFIDSCFWHKCPIHYKVPATNSDFWEKKITGNMLRDKEVNNIYSNMNWKILRIWEHDIKNDFDKAIDKIISFINAAKA